MIRIGTILHCTDFSDAAQQAWNVSKMLAHDYGATLVLLHVGHSGEYSFEDETVTVDPVDSAHERLKSMARQVGSLPVACEVMSGEPGPQIVEAAKEWNADLIIMGNHGQTDRQKMILGSVAEYVVRNAKCAVMTLKPGTGWALSQEATSPQPVKNSNPLSR